ncbi:hypothetical protein CJ030_MR1G003744 [Morella rubra]|uniref:Uncharacterized protein n=1 Tax=Morella rubra TaxID=262757 RepID=A0A6A1WLW9_9ROSI|nr:hypothetical protein CJ030_MR1G003744 [Morella rubra]
MGNWQDLPLARWEHVKEDFLDAGTFPRTCVGGNDKGRVVANLLAELCHIAHTVTWQGKLRVIGCAGRLVKPHVSCMLDLRSYALMKLEAPKKHAGYVPSMCYWEI